MQLSDFDYDLPEELIAQHPPQVRGASRLLHCAAGRLHDLAFADLPCLLRDSDLLVFNDTRVIKARLFGTKESGGRVEVLIERVLAAIGEVGSGTKAQSHRALAQVRASHSPRAGSSIVFEQGASARVIGRDEELFILEFSSPVLQLLEEQGQLPLPPYIRRSAGDFDEERYQTVFAASDGAVAAPTAGLHFDLAILARLRTRGIDIGQLTLHVGAGTFAPVRVENISDHVMHAERYEISASLAEQVGSARQRGGRVVAVGTTSLRALESAAGDRGSLRVGSAETRIFIAPGYRFRIVDALVTNFHLPRSTLLMLVSAFAGMDRIREAYRHAVNSHYRFFSYGDAMFLERDPGLVE